MGRVRIRQVCQFSINLYWNNIGCIIFVHIFGVGGSRLWDNEEGKDISRNNSKRSSIRRKIYVYDVFAYSILFITFFILLWI